MEVKELGQAVLSVTNATSQLYVGETLKLKVQSSNAKKKLSYSSSNKTIATVSGSGKITAKKAGEVVITIKDAISGAELSLYITIKKPYIAPQVEKNHIILGSTYQFVGVGYGLENTQFTWYSSNKKVGTIGTKTGKFKALKEGKTKITMKDKTSGKKYSFQVEVYSVSNRDLEKYISVETNGLISAEMEQRVTKLLYEVYPEVFDYFADGQYEKITCTFDYIGGVAYTMGRDMYIDVDYINANPEDLDCITHELIHCAQAYNTYDQVWLVEGITDYGRNLFGLYNKEANWSLASYAPGQSYTDSYQVTGGFLKYVAENHNKNIIDILNKQLKVGVCPDSLWVEATDYTIDELWELYSKN